jgi:Flp pilus assembly protein TadG
MSSVSSVRAAQPAQAMDRKRGLRVVLERFARNDRGNVAIIFGFTTLIIVSCVGGAVDFGRWLSARNQTQSAIDTALLAAGRTAQTNAGNVTLSVAAAETYYTQMKSPIVIDDTIKFEAINSATSFTAKGTAYVPTPFLSLVGIEKIAVLVEGGAIQASATIAQGGNTGTSLEIAMMLDTTGSMCNKDNSGNYLQPCTTGTKISAVKQASKDLIDIVVWADQSQYQSRVAIAPFSQGVNVGDFFQAVTGKTTTAMTHTETQQRDKQVNGQYVYNYPSTCYNSRQTLKSSCNGNSQYRVKEDYQATITDRPATEPCVVERQGSAEFSNVAPGTGTYVTPWYEAVVNVSNYSTATKVGCPSRTSIIPLTNDKDKLKTAIDGMTAENGTAGAAGTAWPFYMLSPEWNTAWPASAADDFSKITQLNASGQPKLQKIAVLMTDGAYNQWNGTSNNIDVATINSKALSLCTAMKNKKIIVYTVGFELGTDTTAKDMLKSCATDIPYFYDAANSDQLKAAFRDIALKVSALRLDH